MEVQSSENAALLKLLKTKSRTKTELLKDLPAVLARQVVRELATLVPASGTTVRTFEHNRLKPPSNRAAVFRLHS
jgi:hypothetical protein